MNMLKDHVVPGIMKSMWWHHRDSGCPEAGRRIWVQADGASPHTSAYTRNRIRYLESDRFFNRHGFRLKFVQQPANSPDMNICDLTFWHSNKCTLKGKRWTSKQEMINDIKQAWIDYPREKLEAGWRILYTIYRGILRTGGNNNFSRHAGVRTRIRNGLGVDYDCPQDIFEHGESERDRLEIILGLQPDSDYGPDSEAGASASDNDPNSDSE